jgi:hypothetical protein
VTVPASRTAIDVDSYNRTLLTCIQCISGLGRLKLFFAESTPRRVGVKPKPIEEPVLVRRDDNHFPKHGMVRAIPVNDQDSLINLE